MTKTKDDHGLNNAKGHFWTIMGHYASHQKAYKNDDYDMIEEVEKLVHDEALSVEWRCAEWMPAGDSDFKADQGRILLTWGGPALQLVVGLEDGQPVAAELQYQDWGTPWTNLTYGSNKGFDVIIDDDKGEAALLWFASQFYWGE